MEAGGKRRAGAEGQGAPEPGGYTVDRESEKQEVIFMLPFM